MACGTGKTLTALWIAERLQSSPSLVLVPSLSLVQQNVAEWGRCMTCHCLLANSEGGRITSPTTSILQKTRSNSDLVSSVNTASPKTPKQWHDKSRHDD